MNKIFDRYDVKLLFWS